MFFTTYFNPAIFFYILKFPMPTHESEGSCVRVLELSSLPLFLLFSDYILQLCRQYDILCFKFYFSLQFFLLKCLYQTRKVMGHVYVCQGSCICVPGVMYVCTRGHVCVCQGSCMCVLRVMYVCARGIEFTALSTIIRLYFGTVPTVRYFSVFFLFIYIFNL